THRDFGITQVAAVGKITGTVFDDPDGDGTRDSTELGRSGWTVYLDINKNSVLDSGERSTITDFHGDFAFNSLAAGIYYVQFVHQAGFKTTTAWSQSVTLATGQTR